MPHAAVADSELHYELQGPAGAPLLVLSHALGADLTMWEAQAAALSRSFRVLRYDARGHGGSPATAPPYTLDQLAGDLVGLLDALELSRVHICGLSMGGLVGMWVGRYAADRVLSLTLANTGARIGSTESWSTRITAVSGGGLASVSGGVMERWFTPAFRAAAPATVATTRTAFERTSAAGYLGCCAAIRDADLRGELGSIRARTLVIAGRADTATTPEDGRIVAGGIRGARYLELEAAHLSSVEAAEAFTAALAGFLGGEES
jgi:3-oxoadipate enol-lactonase